MNIKLSLPVAEYNRIVDILELVSEGTAPDGAMMEDAEEALGLLPKIETGN